MSPNMHPLPQCSAPLATITGEGRVRHPRHLLAPFHRGASHAIAGKPAIAEILPDHPYRAEQSGDGPDHVHDPHVLRMTDDVDQNKKEAYRTKN